MEGLFFDGVGSRYRASQHHHRHAHAQKDILRRKAKITIKVLHINETCPFCSGECTEHHGDSSQPKSIRQNVR